MVKLGRIPATQVQKLEVEANRLVVGRLQTNTGRSVANRVRSWSWQEAPRLTANQLKKGRQQVSWLMKENCRLPHPSLLD